MHQEYQIRTKKFKSIHFASLVIIHKTLGFVANIKMHHQLCKDHQQWAVDQYKCHQSYRSHLYHKRAICLSVCPCVCRDFSQRWPNRSSPNFQRFISECLGMFSGEKYIENFEKKKVGFEKKQLFCLL